MSDYKLTITKTRPNENFEAQLKDYNERSGRSYGVQAPYPETQIVEKTLETTVTEEEFAAIKKAALGVMSPDTPPPDFQSLLRYGGLKAAVEKEIDSRRRELKTHAAWERDIAQDAARLVGLIRADQSMSQSSMDWCLGRLRALDVAKLLADDLSRPYQKPESPQPSQRDEHL